VQPLKLPAHTGPQQLRQLYETLGGNFRGLTFFLQAAEAMSATEEAAFLAQLATAEQELQTNMAIERVVGELSEAARTLLQRLPVYTTPVPVEGIKKIALDLPAPAQLLQRLVEVSLVEVEVAHDLQAYQYACVAPVAAWLRQHGAYRPDSALLGQAADYQRYLFETDRPTVTQALTVHQALQRAERREEANRFALKWIIPDFDRVGLYRTLLETWLPPLRQSADRQMRGDAYNWTGKTYHALGDYDTALDYLKQSLAIQQQIGDQSGEGRILNNISQIFQARGDYDTALDYLKQSLAIAQQIGDQSGEGTTLNNISQIFQARGEYDTALDYLKQSLAIVQQIGDQFGEGRTLNNISSLYYARGEYDTALDYLKQSLALAQQIGDKAQEGATLNNISQIYDARGDYDTALDYLKQALALAQQIGNKSGEGTTLNNISQIYGARGDYDTALDYLKQSLAIQQQIGDTAGLCVTLFNIGHIHWQNEARQEAVSAWVTAYTLAKRIGYAQVLQALDELAKRLGGPGLELLEQLAQRSGQ
jgi:tetratricopeptide (TPR) repeat protein